MTSLVKVQGGLQLAQGTAARFETFRARVKARTGYTVRITGPYGAFRSPADQAHMRWLYLTGQGAYAAPVGDSMHEQGRAWDNSSWSMHTGIVEEEAKAAGFVRDRVEKWHWNDYHSAPAYLSLVQLAPDVWGLPDTPAPPKRESRNEVSTVYVTGKGTPDAPLVFALAGDGVGQGAWIEFEGLTDKDGAAIVRQLVDSKHIKREGATEASAVYLPRYVWDQWKKYYLDPAPVRVIP